MDRQQDVIRRITSHIIAYRFQLENERNSRMAIEIKGLKADALTARANLDKLRAAYAKFNEAAPAHAADVEGLATTIGGMQSDLEFAATVMGNSSGESERLSDGQKPPVVPPNILAGVGDLNQPKTAPESIVAQQSAIGISGESLESYLNPNRPGMLPSGEPTEPHPEGAAPFRVALGPHPEQPEVVTAQTFPAMNNRAAQGNYK